MEKFEDFIGVGPEKKETGTVLTVLPENFHRRSPHKQMSLQWISALEDRLVSSGGPCRKIAAGLNYLAFIPRQHRLQSSDLKGNRLMAAVTSFCASSLLPPLVLQYPLRHIGLRKFVMPKYIKHAANVKGARHHHSLKEVSFHQRLVVLAVTEGSAKSNQSDEKIPSWGKPDSVEPPPWARDEGNVSTSQPSIEIPYFAYLLASAITAIAAIGSIFEYINQRPVFGVLNSDNLYYVPVLGFFALTGIPTSAFLWFKSVQVANKQAEEQDKRDGYL